MNGKAKTNPRIIAFNYYDGATEGIAESILDGSDCYFTLIAWDCEQDERLFAVVRLDHALYEKVRSLFELSEGASTTSVWLPKWNFRSSDDEAEVEAFVDSCRRRLLYEGFLVRARQIEASADVKLKIVGETASRVEGVLSRGVPDDLINWKSVPDQR